MEEIAKKMAFNSLLRDQVLRHVGRRVDASCFQFSLARSVREGLQVYVEKPDGLSILSCEIRGLFGAEALCKGDIFQFSLARSD